MLGIDKDGSSWNENSCLINKAKKKYILKLFDASENERSFMINKGMKKFSKSFSPEWHEIFVVLWILKQQQR